MYFRDIVGHDSLKAQLLTTARQGLVPHAQLFTGRDGEGALGLAYAYARYLNCTDHTGSVQWRIAISTRPSSASAQ